MGKVLVEVYNYYGKNDGEDIVAYITMEDTPEKRRELVEEWAWDIEDIFDNIDDFTNGFQDELHISLIGGDWDEPTGRQIVIKTKEEAIEIAEAKFKREIERIEGLFK